MCTAQTFVYSVQINFAFFKISEIRLPILQLQYIDFLLKASVVTGHTGVNNQCVPQLQNHDRSRGLPAKLCTGLGIKFFTFFVSN